jgi:hypothetical protein
MLDAHFEHLPTLLCRHLAQASRRVQVAVCWFSHREIFDLLLQLVRKNVEVALLMEYDSQNIRDGGLDFQSFIRAGGQLWGSRSASLMHHKFAIVDDRVLLTGSFNWTYNSNAENLLVTDDPDVVAAFSGEFARQQRAAQRVHTIDQGAVKTCAAFPLFEKTTFDIADLRKKISAGAGVWTFFVHKIAVGEPLFPLRQIPFDKEGLLRAYWATQRNWDEQVFSTEIAGMATQCPAPLLRSLRRWCLRLKIGDLVLALHQGKKGSPPQILALGIIQSGPQRCQLAGHSSCRAVQWLQTWDTPPCPLDPPPKTTGLAPYRSSGLRLLQALLGTGK